MDEWIKKIWCIHIYIDRYIHTHTHTMEKDEILPFAITWLYLEVIMLSEISQTEKENNL